MLKTRLAPGSWLRQKLRFASQLYLLDRARCEEAEVNPPNVNEFEK